MRFSKEIKIGLLMVFTIAIFVWGYSFLKGKNIFRPANTYYAVYDRVEGLLESAHVILSGYKIGHVDDINFTDDFRCLVVTISLDKRILLPEGTTAKIHSADIMGSKAVEIIPGHSDRTMSSGDTLLTLIEPGLMEEINVQILPLKLRAEEMLASLDSLLIIFQAVFNESFRENFAESIENIGKTMGSLQRSVYSVDTLLTIEGSRFNRIMDNLESITGNISGSNEDISTILENFASISDSLVQSELISNLNNLNEVLDEAGRMIKGIAEGEGSLGKLMVDEELYNNLENATRNLDLLLIDLKENPGRYINFSVFGRRRD